MNTPARQQRKQCSAALFENIPQCLSGGVPPTSHARIRGLPHPPARQCCPWRVDPSEAINCQQLQLMCWPLHSVPPPSAPQRQLACTTGCQRCCCPEHHVHGRVRQRSLYNLKGTTGQQIVKDMFLHWAAGHTFRRTAAEEGSTCSAAVASSNGDSRNCTSLPCWSASAFWPVMSSF